MVKKFEIFSTEVDLNTKSSAIDVLLGYPNTPNKTTMYRCGLEKYQSTDWVGCVDDNLVDACASMTPAQRLQYYDDSDLKTPQWLVDNNWYPPY